MSIPDSQSEIVSSGAFPWEASYPRNVDYHAKIPTAPLPQLLDEAVAKFPDRPAILFQGKRYTYRELGAKVDCLAQNLAALGVKRGVKIGLFLPNCPYFVWFFFAVLKAGGTIVNFNPLYAEPEIAKQIQDSETRMMVTLDVEILFGKVRRMLEQTRLEKIILCRMVDVLKFPQNLLYPIVKRKARARVIPDARVMTFAELRINSSPLPDLAIHPLTDIAVLQYTGGTTGVPKGAMLSHANLYANAIQSRLWFGEIMQPGKERILGVLPLFHVFAMTSVMILGIAVGAEMIFLPRFEVKTVLKTIAKRKPSFVPGVPTMFTALNNCAATPRYDLSSIRACISGGAPLPLEVKQRFETLTGCRLVEGYGLTETSPVLTINPADGRARAGSIGLPVPATILEIRDKDDPAMILPQGEIGEIVAAGPQIMLGYWRHPEETHAAMVHGFFRTGDIGFIDSDGFFYIVDRIKDIIIASGFNIYPRNVEEAIYQHQAVLETTVIGVPDDYRGETVKAFIVVKPGKSLTESELRQFLKPLLSPMEMPKQIEFRASLPKTMIGKLSRKELVAEEAKKRSVV